MQNPPHEHHDKQDTDLLDLLVALSENIKLLICVPLLVGLMALGASFAIPKTFESVAVLQSDQTIASLMLTAAVLDPVAAKLGLTRDDTVEGARIQLRENIRLVVGRNDKLLTVKTTANSAEEAQTLGRALLAQVYVESRPKGSTKERLEGQLTEARLRLDNAKTAATGMLKRLESTVVTTNGGAELARGYADLLNATGVAQTQISALEAQLEGLNDAQLVQSPTLPEKASQPKKSMIAIGVAVATGLILLLFVILRYKVIRESTDPHKALKWTRVFRGLGLRRG